jgi:hypothetical protein
MPLQIRIESYVTIDEANEYISGKVYATDWETSDTSTKEKALKEACRKINRLQFKGQKSEPGQILEFPRKMPVLGRLAVIGFMTGDEVPDEVKAAQCEEALAILKYGNSARTKAQEQNIVSVKIGDVSETYKGRVGRLMSHDAYDLLRDYIAGSVAIK